MGRGRPKRTETAQPSIRTRCRAINAAIREGVVVKANIQGTMQTLISITFDALGVTLLFHDDEKGVTLFKVAPSAILEFTVQIPREQEASV